MEKITKVIELSKDKREELKRMQHASGELEKSRQDILEAAKLLGCTRENSYKCQKVWSIEIYFKITSVSNVYIHRYTFVYNFYDNN